MKTVGGSLFSVCSVLIVDIWLVQASVDSRRFVGKYTWTFQQLLQYFSPNDLVRD